MRIEKVGLMTPGDMGQAVALQIKARGFSVSTALDGRSARSRALAQVALREIMQDALDGVAHEPAVRDLIQQQSLSMADEALGAVRERAVHADIFVDNLQRRLLRRPRPYASVTGDQSASGEP